MTMRIWVVIVGALLLLALTETVFAAPERDVILVLDNSGSMRGNDPDRLSIAAVNDFIRAQSPRTRVGVVIFDGSARLVQPLASVDASGRERLLNSLESLDFTGQWTEIAGAVERGLYELRLNSRQHAERILVLMTDGIIDTGNEQRDQERRSWLRDQLAPQARDEDVRVFGIAFTENADYQLLQSLAHATGGEYFRALRAADLGTVLQRIDRVLERPVLPEAQEREPLNDAGAGPGDDAGQPVERLVFDEQPQAVVAETGDVDGPSAAPMNGLNTDAAREGNGSAGVSATGPWRVVLILVALLVLGVVGVSILWGEELNRFWQRKARSPREAEDNGPKAVLYDVHDPSDIKRHELGGRPIVIGRVSGSDPAMDYIVVDERTVGRWHATIERRGQSFWIRDEGSVNGTYVNDQRVTNEHPLKHGDMVRVHRHEFEFVIPEMFDSDRTMISAEARVRNPAAEGA